MGQARQFGTANQPQRQDRKQHLYLVLDDQENGFSIRKLDLDNDLDVGSTSTDTPLLLPEPPLDVGCISTETPMRLCEQPLPEPPVVCLELPAVSHGAQFAAIGSHIIAISPSTMGRPLVEGSPNVTLVFDTKAHTLLVSYALPEGLLCGYDAAIAVRDRLYVFESFTDNSFDFFCFRGGLHCLAAGPCDDESHWEGWQPLSDSSTFVWSWSDSPPEFLFDPKTITGHVVHPKTGTIFVSAGGHVSCGTFSYDMGGGGQWKCLGDWLLPFKGPAHYDEVLDAWVGLHLHSFDTGDADGYLCACSVMSGSQQPNWKVGREMLFLNHPYWSHVDAKLVYMGERSKYCLLERLLPKGADKVKYVLRLTTFIVKYDEDGDLMIMANQPARFYKAPSYGYCFDIQAFWM